MDEAARKKTLRMIPHGLQIVTVRDGDQVHGYTSSWMTQVSFTPPLIAMGVRADSRSGVMLKKTGRFVVHFPDRDQVGVAKSFFKPPEAGEGTLGGIPFTPGPATGCPVLAGFLAHAECRVVHVWEGGDHAVVVAEVLDAVVHRDGDPLLLSHTPWQYGG